MEPLYSFNLESTRCPGLHGVHTCCAKNRHNIKYHQASCHTVYLTSSISPQSHLHFPWSKIASQAGKCHLHPFTTFQNIVLSVKDRGNFVLYCTENTKHIDQQLLSVCWQATHQSHSCTQPVSQGTPRLRWDVAGWAATHHYYTIPVWVSISLLSVITYTSQYTHNVSTVIHITTIPYQCECQYHY